MAYSEPSTDDSYLEQFAAAESKLATLKAQLDEYSRIVDGVKHTDKGGRFSFTVYRTDDDYDGEPMDPTALASVNPYAAAEQWQDAEDAVETFLDWTYSDEPEQEDDLAEALEERLDAVNRQVQHIDSYLSQRRSTTIDVARQEIDPAYAAERAVDEADYVLGKLEETINAQETAIDEYWNGADDVYDTIDQAELVEKTAVAAQVIRQVPQSRDGYEELRQAFDELAAETKDLQQEIDDVLRDQQTTTDDSEQTGKRYGSQYKAAP